MAFIVEAFEFKSELANEEQEKEANKDNEHAINKKAIEDDGNAS